MMVAETAEVAARNRMPPWNEPVAFSISPIAMGPTKPPRLAMALMSPMLPAAAVPCRNSRGRA